MSKFNSEWHSSIVNISELDWVRIFGNSRIKSYHFFKAMEFAALKDSTFLYLTISDQNRIAGIVPCFLYNLKLDVIASTHAKKIFNIIRRLYPNFMKINIFGVGSLASTCEHHIGISPDLSKADYDSIGDIISMQIKLKSKELKYNLVFIKEVPNGKLCDIKRLLSKDFCFYYSLPNCFIPLCKETSPYPTGLRRKERQRYRVMKNKFDLKYKWELVSDFEKITGDFEKMYLNTLSKSKNQFEILNKKFFDELKNGLKDDTFLLVAKNVANEGYESIGIVINEENSLIPLYLRLNDNNSLETIKLLHMNSITSISAIKLSK